MISKLIKRGNALIFSVTAKNIYLVSSGNFVSIIAGFIFYIIIARSLTPSNLGVFASLSAFILIISDLTEFGFGAGLSAFIPPLLKENNHNQINKILKSTFLFQSSLGIIFALVIILFPSLFSKIIFGSEYQSYIYLTIWSAFGIISYSIFNFAVSQFVSKEHFKGVFRIQSFQSVLKVVFALMYMMLAALNVEVILAIFIIAPLISIALIPLKSFAGFLSDSGWYPLRNLLRFNVYMALNKIFVVLFSRLDLIMLTSLSTTYEAGLYSLASRVAFTYPLIGGSIGTVFGPKYSKLNIDQAIKFTKKSFLVIFLLIISEIILILISPFLIPFVFGTNYINAIPILQVLLLGTIPFLIAIPINNLITFSLKKPYIIAVSSLVQLILVFSLNLVLIPRLGGIAAAISVGISSIIALFISLFSFYIYVWSGKR